MQRFVVASHRRAFRKLLSQLPPFDSATIVGGGLFPRTALILRELLPEAQLTIIDLSACNLETARGFLGDSVEYRQERYGANASRACELTVIPLCFEGDRDAPLSASAFVRHVLVHDWIWRRRGPGAIVSLALLKRVNLVRQ